MNSRRLLLAVAAVCVSPSLWAAPYVYTGLPYTTIMNFTICGTGPCANYLLGQKVSGQFTTAAPLAPNLGSKNVFLSITSYSFTDGINTYSSGNPNSRVQQFEVSTDAGGNIIGVTIFLVLWQSGSPHNINDRVALLQTAFVDAPNNNLFCLSVGTESSTGVMDSCLYVAPDDSSSRAGTNATGTWSTLVQLQSVPTLSEWAMLLLSLLVVGFAVRALNGRKGARFA